jgi:hypothetical protein
MGVVAGVNAVNDGLIFTIDAGNQFCYPKFSNGTVCGTANEGSNLTLTAPSGAIFDQIVYASYGTPDGTCGLYTNGACHATGSTSIVATYLLNNSTGTIPATNAVFGDPCGGTYKRLYVEARYRYTNANDLTAKSNNAILVNGVGFTTTNSGSFSFDGTNDYMDCGYNSSINNATQWTFECWYRSSSINTEGMLFSTYTNTPSNLGYHIEIYQSKLMLQIWPASTYTQSSTTLSNNVWYQLIVTYNSGSVSYYVNGESAGTASYTFTPSSANLLIGKWPTNNYFLNGQLASVRFYNKVISAFEIKQNYNSTKRRFL